LTTVEIYIRYGSLPLTTGNISYFNTNLAFKRVEIRYLEFDCMSIAQSVSEDIFL
jgi:hypothetical protein